jgi:hypothetical protein
LKVRTQPTLRRRATTAVPLLVICALTCATLAAPAPEKRTATHGGVSITYDAALAREVRAETAPAAPLESADEKPDGVYPEHVAFTLVGVGGAPAESFNEPLIRVCPVDAYLKAFSVSPRYVRDARRTLGELRSLIRRRPAALTGNVPALPFADATEVFHARVKYLRFRGAASHEDYTLPREVGTRRARQLYSAYVERVRRKLERLRPAQFQPDLRLYDELLSSLDIRK